MLILLPPSEGKTAGGDGPKVDLKSLSWHRELGRTRTAMVRELVSLCRGDRANARDVLGLSEALDEDRAAGAKVRTAPTMPAGLRYCGVLYDALDYSTLPTKARHRADEQLVTFSGLWGAVRPTDQLPAYRIGINSRLPDQPGIPVIWKAAIGKALASLVEADGAIDLRSAGYSQMMQLPKPVAAKVVKVAVNGSSFASKQAKGSLVRELLTADADGIDGLLTAARTLRLAAEQTGDATVTVDVPMEWACPGLGAGRHNPDTVRDVTEPGPRRELAPTEVDAVPVLIAGTVLWVIALVLLSTVFRHTLEHHHATWWLYACGIGAVLGLYGIRFASRHRPEADDPTD